ncbi:hypothetical protein [Kitasatospora sp. NPDC057198]|uniref:hypothetical protein n=1 Tax=Kitasatospora sp. NPDC057198 TaxID=3346046 RepID=UPI003627EA5C
MIIENGRRSGASWWGTVVDRLRARGLRLLAVVAAATAVQLVVLEVLRALSPSYQVGRVLVVVLDTLVLSYEYGVAVRLLASGPGTGWAAVLRVPGRQFGRVALWSVLLSLETLVGLLIVFWPDTFLGTYRGLLGVALVLPTALGGALNAALPTVAFLEDGGVRACWRLLCSGWATAARLCAIALGARLAGAAITSLYSSVFFRGGSRLALDSVNALAAPVGFVTVLLLFATYLRSPAARPTAQAVAPAATTVDALFEPGRPSGTVGA